MIHLFEVRLHMGRVSRLLCKDTLQQGPELKVFLHKRDENRGEQPSRILKLDQGNQGILEGVRHSDGK